MKCLSVLITCTYGFVDSLVTCVATGQKLTIHSHVVHARETLYSEKESISEDRFVHDDNLTSFTNAIFKTYVYHAEDTVVIAF